MANIVIFDGTFPPVPGNTPFGQFDTDIQFVSDAPKVGKSIVARLGFPILDIELRAEQIYACFEDAVMTYSSEVNKYNIRENMLNLQGSPTNTNLTHKEISLNLGRIVTISKQYGAEAGAGGDVDWKKGYLYTSASVQNYDLDEIWADTVESGSKIEIKKIYHYERPVSNYFYGGFANILPQFGWHNSQTGQSKLNYLLNPIYDNLLKIQQIKFSNEVRKSGYSFFIVNNKLSLFPIPVYSQRLWFDYILVGDRDNPLKEYSGSLDSGSMSSNYEEYTQRVSDISNVPYNYMYYTNINSPGKSWIREYAFASVKETLGMVRAKYQSIPSLDGSEISLDGDTLRSEGTTLKDQLIEQLKEMLEASSRRIQMEAKEAEAEHMTQILNKVPLGIYIY